MKSIFHFYSLRRVALRGVGQPAARFSALSSICFTTPSQPTWPCCALIQASRSNYCAGNFLLSPTLLCPFFAPPPGNTIFRLVTLPALLRAPFSPGAARLCAFQHLSAANTCYFGREIRLHSAFRDSARERARQKKRVFSFLFFLSPFDTNEWE